MRAGLVLPTSPTSHRRPRGRQETVEAAPESSRRALQMSNLARPTGRSPKEVMSDRAKLTPYGVLDGLGAICIPIVYGLGVVFRFSGVAAAEYLSRVRPRSDLSGRECSQSSETEYREPESRVQPVADARIAVLRSAAQQPRRAHSDTTTPRKGSTRSRANHRIPCSSAGPERQSTHSAQATVITNQRSCILVTTDSGPNHTRHGRRSPARCGLLEWFSCRLSDSILQA